MLNLRGSIIIYLLVGITARPKSLCLVSVVMLGKSEYGTPEFYIKCDNGLLANLPAAEDHQMIYDPPICLEENIRKVKEVACVVYEDDLFFDDLMGSFVLTSGTTKTIKGSFNVIVKDKFSVEIEPCICAEKRRQKTT